MDKKKLIYIALGALVLLPSCSQDEPTERELRGDDTPIYFRSYLPSVTQSRATVVNSDNFANCQVTGFNPDDVGLIDSDKNILMPFFSDICFYKNDEGNFVAREEDEVFWPRANNKLHFFAYYPSVASMRETLEEDEDCFTLLNSSSTLSNGKAVFDYRLEKFIVAPEIADQVDFVTAYTSASLSETGNSGIALDFKHQLARVEISAWGANEKYDFEIAGVRIGNPLTKGDFNLSALMTDNSLTPLWRNIGTQSVVQHIFAPGESIALVGSGNHESENDVVSIMGTAGPAMVIPMTSRIEAWEGKNDPAIANVPYTTDRMYFSTLLRVKNRDGKVVYPYPNDRDNMTVIYFAIDTDGKIAERLYKSDDQYFTTPDPTDDDAPYVPGDNEQICGFGWASLPVAARWEAGKIYTYKLNYTSGIGWHDPSDPTPGEPIIERGMIPFEVSVSEWIPADDYNSDLTVPKR